MNNGGVAMDDKVVKKIKKLAYHLFVVSILMFVYTTIAFVNNIDFVLCLTIGIVLFLSGFWLLWVSCRYKKIIADKNNKQLTDAMLTDAKNETTFVECGTCGGSGALRAAQDTSFGRIVQQRSCSECSGKGRIIK